MKPHILIIASDPNAARITRAVVERVAAEATITVEACVEGALGRWHDNPPDILIIDPPRHRLAAIQLLRDLKTLARGMYVIVLASVPTPGLRREMQHLGVDVYLEKPALLTHVVDALRTILQRLPVTVIEHRDMLQNHTVHAVEPVFRPPEQGVPG